MKGSAMNKVINIFDKLFDASLLLMYVFGFYIFTSPIIESNYVLPEDTNKLVVMVMHMLLGIFIIILTISIKPMMKKLEKLFS